MYNILKTVCKILLPLQFHNIFLSIYFQKKNDLYFLEQPNSEKTKSVCGKIIFFLKNWRQKL